MQKVIPSDAILIPDKAQKVFKGVIYDVYQWDQANFDDSVVIFEMLRRPDTVVVIGIVDDKIMVIEDEQPHRGMRVTFPGGRVDPEDDDPLTAAQRETLEETGYSFVNWRLVQVVQPQTKMEWFVFLYVAWNVNDQTEPDPGPGEKIVLDFQSVADIKKLLNNHNSLIGESRQIFENVQDLDQLKTLPEFQGQSIDR